MIDSVILWIKDIIFVVLFATFLELLLPNNSMQRFVRVIMGLLIMIAVLNPVVRVIHNYIIPEQIPTMSGNGLQAAEIINVANDTFQKREELARQIYKNDLAKQIQAMVKTVDGVAEAKAVVELDNKRLNIIQRIIVYIKPGKPQNDNSVKKVVIGNQNYTDSEDVSRKAKGKIRRMIAELYGLKDEYIEVQSMK